jgi:hypothetical protein
MNGRSASGLADLASVTEAEVQWLVDLGILVAPDGANPFLAADVKKVRFAIACKQRRDADGGDGRSDPG